MSDAIEPDHSQAACAVIERQLAQQGIKDFRPQFGLILGSGLGSLVDLMEVVQRFDYASLPGFPTCSVAGHHGELIAGYCQGTPVICLSGRSHLYEGKPISHLKTLIRTLKNCGCHSLIMTNAVGSLRENVGPGSVVAITDHINMMFSNPLVGPNDEAYGPRFLALDNAYDSNLRQVLRQIADKDQIPLSDGIYLGVIGPSFETPAEINAYRILGADVVGMSTIPETIIARHCGLKVLALSIVTNFAAGMEQESLSHDITLAGAKLAHEKVTKLLLSFFAQQN